MQKKRIDIIVPIYNQEKVISNFLNSLKNFNSDNFNVILVNDGSKDNTPNLIKIYLDENKLSNFFLLEKDNGGASSARNLGLKHAVSDYVWFCDPDDHVSNNVNLKLDAILENTPDVIMFPFCHRNDNAGTEKVINPSFKAGIYPIFSVREILINNRLYTSSGNSHLIYPWDKIIKRDVIKVNFDDDRAVYEDQIFNFNLLDSISGDVKFVDEILYTYVTYKQSTSLSNSWSSKKTNDFIHFVKFLVSNFGSKSYNLYTREIIYILRKTPAKDRFSVLCHLIKSTGILPRVFIYKSYLPRLVYIILGGR